MQQKYLTFEQNINKFVLLNDKLLLKCKDMHGSFSYLGSV